MIVRDEFDMVRFDGPRPYRIPIFRPLGINEDLDPSVAVTNQIIFCPEYDTDVHSPEVYIKVWDVPWRWCCQDCYGASGDRRDIFKTDWARREDLGGKGNRNAGGFNEATYNQQQQMNQHAKQHSIMWSWAKGLK